jgi:hypothetical protein
MDPKYVAAKCTTPDMELNSGVPQSKMTLLGAGVLQNLDSNNGSSKPQDAVPLVSVTYAAGGPSCKGREMGGSKDEACSFPVAKVSTKMGKSCKAQDTSTLQSPGTSQAVPNELDSINKNIENLYNLIQGLSQAGHSTAAPSTKRAHSFLHHSSDSDHESRPSKKSKEDLNDLFSDSEEEDDILGTIPDDFLGETGVGPPVKNTLAEKINNRFKNNINHENIKDKQKQYLRPSNCQKMSVPLCNEELWKKLPRDQQLKDIKSAQTQHLISYAVAAITQVTDSLLCGAKCKDTLNIPELVGKLLDAVLFLGHTSNEVSMKRRDAIVSSLKKEFSGLRSRSIPVTDYLFGDDILKVLKDLKQTATLTASTSYQFNYQPKNWRGPQQNRWKQRKQTAGGRNKGRGKHSKPSYLH